MRGYGAISIDNPGWLEVDRPQCGPLDAIVRPTAIAPCSSDTHTLHAGPADHIILGHEALGEVVEVGSYVKDFKPGDKVVVPCCTPDWEAPDLQRKHSNNAHDRGLMASFKYLLQIHGVFAEFFKVNNADANLVHMPDDISVEDALMTVDMMSNGFYGAEQAGIQIGDTVVVFGIGPVGLMAVAGARALGAGRIIAIGTRPNCVALAKEFGATDIVSYKDGDVADQILKLVPEKVDGVVLAGGKASVLNQALRIVRCNGTISNINFFDPSDTFDVKTYEIGLGMADITLKNGFCPGGSYRIRKLLNMIRADRVHPGKMLNYKYEGFDKIPEAFDVMDKKPRDLIKPIVYINW